MNKKEEIVSVNEDCFSVKQTGGKAKFTQAAIL